MTVRDALAAVLDGRNLTEGEASEVMSHLMLGEVHHGLMGGFLVGMAAKGVTGAELAGFAKTMRSRAVPMSLGVENLVDTCGTGGGRPTFNLSTGAALLAAAAGAKVAKHGNRAVTSHCGSADVLEELGVPIENSLDEKVIMLQDFGFLFLFAPSHHPAVRHVAPVRQALGIRTFFNLLGPLANPAGAKRQMIGVYDAKFLRPMGEALSLLGVEDAYVVHGTDQLDEVSPQAETLYIRVQGDHIEEGSWRPEDFGVTHVSDEDMSTGSTVHESGEILRQALSGKDQGRAAALVPNTAVTLVLAGCAKDISEGADLALATLADGSALNLIDRMASPR